MWGLQLMKSDTGARQGGHTCKPDSPEAEAGGLPRVSDKSVLHSKSPSQRQYEGVGEWKVTTQRGARGCREQTLLRREMRVRNLCPVTPQFRSKGKTKSGALFQLSAKVNGQPSP